MYGAILGDMIGSPYEFDNPNKTKDFPLFSRKSRYTDDTVMTLAVAKAFLDAQPLRPEDLDRPETVEKLKDLLCRSMRSLGNAYPNAGYGKRFFQWLQDPEMGPYNSFGNGSAMRVSPVAWLFPDLKTVRRAAALSASVTHDHPEGIKGAEAVASVIFLARIGETRENIRQYITDEFGYDLNRTCDEIRPDYRFDVTCMGSVPEAILAFLESEDFEDTVRTAVSLGGDTDTQAAIAGSMAEAYYGVPEELKLECRERLPKRLAKILDRFEEQMVLNPAVNPKYIFHFPGNEDTKELEDLKQALIDYEKYETGDPDQDQDRISAVLEAVCQAMKHGDSFFVPVEFRVETVESIIANGVEPGTEFKVPDGVSGIIRTLTLESGNKVYPVFTRQAEAEAGPPTSTMAEPIDAILENALMNPEIDGVILDPWSTSFVIPTSQITVLLDALVPDPESAENCICIVTMDITEADTDCIVNAANKSLLGGGGVDGAIHRAAGPELLAECKTLNGCETGEAKMTRGYDLPAKFVIHTVGPVYSGSENDAVLLARCYWNSLELARLNDLHSIAFPAISTGVYGYPLKEAAEIALRTVEAWVKANPCYGMNVLFTCYNDKITELYRNIWSEIEEHWCDRFYPLKNNGELEQAITLALDCHKGAVRKGTDRPYILHPVETLQILASMDADPDLLAAGVLHDTLEDTDLTLLDVYEQFGMDVAALVNGNTEDKRQIWYLRKLRSLRALPGTDTRQKMLILADKLSNLRSMTADYRRVGEELWNRFNAPKPLQAWYFSGIIEGLEKLRDYEETEPAYLELCSLYRDLFAQEEETE